jgi:cephalosporin hydroxylase
MSSAIRESVKKFIPQEILNFYGNTKRMFMRMMRNVPPEEKVSFNLRSIYAGHFKVTYRHIPTLRMPFDYVLYQMILTDVRPDLVIEIGTNFGGTTLYFADLMDALGHGAVHSIDIDNRADNLVVAHPRIKLFHEGWEKYDIRETSGFKKILVIDDGSHMYEDVLSMMQKFAPIVSPNSYFIIEDGIVEEVGLGAQYHGGPIRAIREFMKVHPEFQVDRTYCDFFGINATANVNGYLRKNA